MDRSNIHLDTSILMEKQLLDSLITNNNVKRGRYVLVISPFALAEYLHNAAKEKHCNSAERLCNLIAMGDLEVFHLSNADLDLFIQAITQLRDEAKWIGLNDILIFATAISDPHAEYFLTADEKLALSKKVQEVRRQLKPTLKIDTEL